MYHYGCDDQRTPPNFLAATPFSLLNLGGYVSSLLSLPALFPPNHLSWPEETPFQVLGHEVDMLVIDPHNAIGSKAKHRLYHLALINAHAHMH